MAERDWKAEPELRNDEFVTYYFLSPHHQITESWIGRCVKVIDGDTIRVTHPRRDFDTVVRMLGINAPELSEGGQDARDWVKSFIEGKEVYIRLAPERVGKWGRILGNVIHAGMDVGDLEVRLGISHPFEQRGQGTIKSIHQTFNLKQWF